MISIALDPAPFTGTLDELQQRQLPFAISQALNDTAGEAQDAIQQRILTGARLTIRSTSSARFLINQVKFYPQERATKRKLEATVRLDASTSKQARSSLLGFLEQGGTREGTKRVGSGQLFPNVLAIPARAKGGAWAPLQTPPRALYPVNLGLSPRKDPSGEEQVFKIKKRHNANGRGSVVRTTASLRGKLRTFVVPTRSSAGAGVVLQRVGPQKADVRLLFSLKPRVNVAGRQFFEPTARAVGEARLGPNMEAALDHAIQTSEKKNT